MSLKLGLPNLKYMLKKVNYYCDMIHHDYGISKIWLFFDFVHCALKYGCDGVEYIAYKFFLLNDRGRNQFISHLQKTIYENKHSSVEKSKIISNKEYTLNLFKDFIQRDWCGVEYNNTEEAYRDFFEKHDKCIVKPTNSFGGHGIRIIEKSSSDIYIYIYTRAA